MGEVYKGRDTRLERHVAIKVLPPHLSSSPDFRLRFEREARVISGLNHPNICTLHDVGREEEVDFLVMEYLEGETLADRLMRGPLPLEQVLRYGVEIAGALDRAHRSGIVHRDLKPGNIMITKSGAKLLDFGLAKPAALSGLVGSGPSMFDDQTRQKPLTAEGQIVGTFQYMAPEQLEGREADARTDIFAFGAILYEMATGRRAFDGKTKASLIASILDREPPPIVEVQPLAPPLLERVIRTALQKDPDDRWQTTHDLMLELKWIAEGGSHAGVAAPVKLSRRRRELAAWTLAAVAALAAIGAALAWNTGRNVERRVTRTSITPPEGARPMFEVGLAGGLTVSPDGRFVTFTAPGENGGMMLWLRPVDSLEARPIAGTEEALFPFWSPDSRSIAFFAEGRLKRISVGGGPAVTICDVEVNPRSGSWNTDDVLIFSPSSVVGIHRVPAAGGKPVPVTTVDAEAGESTHRWATFLPDQKHFLYMIGSHSAAQRSEQNAIYAGSLDGKVRKFILHARSNVAYSAGHLLYVRDGLLVAQPFDAGKLELKGDPQPVAADVLYQPAFFHAAFSVSREGTLLFRSGSRNSTMNVAWLDRSGKEIGTVGENRWFNVTLSPDEKRFIAQVEEPNAGTVDLWLYDLDRKVGTRFTFSPTSEFSPVWSPDGSRIVYAADVINTNQEELWIKPVTGTGAGEKLLATGGLCEPTDWSPDGRFIAFDSRTARNQKPDIWILPMTGERKPFPFLHSAFAETSLQFSPDGRWVSYSSDESGRPEVYVTTFPTPAGKWQISSGGGQSAIWRRGGRELIYASTSGEVRSVPVRLSEADIEIGATQVLFSDSSIMGGDFTRDGERLLAVRMSAERQTAPIVLVTNWDAALGRR
jgi:eukaryotic-like serine/threonine-protein kinase